MRKFLPWLLLIVSCTPSPKENATPPADGAIILEKPTDLIELTEAPHWVYQQVLSIHSTTEALGPSLKGRTLADFDKTKEAGYELLHHREEIKRPQVYADYQGFDAELLTTLMAYTLSDAEINNLHYYGLTSPDTLAGQLLMSWLIMYPPVDFFGAWYPDIAYAGNGFWSEFFTRYYGSAEFTKKMDTSGMTWLEMIERIQEGEDFNGLSLWNFWGDYRYSIEKTRDIRHALLLAQLMEDYQAKRPLPPKLYEALANFLAYHQIAVGFPAHFDDYQPKQTREWWPTASGAPTFIDMNISYHLMNKYNLSNPNTIPGQLLAIQFIDYIHWFDWDGYLEALKGLLGSQQFIEQRLRYSHQEKETYLKEVNDLYAIMEDVDYRWRGGEGEPAEILYEASFVDFPDAHLYYQQAMALARLMREAQQESKSLNLDEIDESHRYFPWVEHRELVGYPADFPDFSGYDTAVIDTMFRETFSQREWEQLKKHQLTRPDSIIGQLLIGWMLAEQPHDRFTQWYPDISLALSDEPFWLEIFSRVYGSRSFIEKSNWRKRFYGDSWRIMLATSGKDLNQNDIVGISYTIHMDARGVESNLKLVTRKRHYDLLTFLLNEETISNPRVAQALDAVLQYHHEAIGFAFNYDDFIATVENLAAAQELVPQLMMFHYFDYGGFIWDTDDYVHALLQFFGSQDFIYHMSQIEEADREDLRKIYDPLRQNLNKYYALLEALYTAVLEEGYRLA